MTEDRVPTPEPPWWSWDTNDDDSWLAEFSGEDVRALVRERNRLLGAASLDVERLGFYDLLDVAEAIMAKAYPPHPLLCSHDPAADIGARTTAAIADLIATCRGLGSAPSRSEPEEVNDDC